MATLPDVKRISREDIPGAPDWIDRLLEPLNRFLDTVYGGLNRGLTFRENFLSQTQSFQIVAGASAASCTASFILTMKAKPFLIFLVATPSGTLGDTASPAFTWNYDGTNINITSISGLTNGVTYNLTAVLI